MKNKPSIISYYPNGNKEKEFWYNEKVLHREDGPSIVLYNEDGSINSERWFLNGVELDEKYFLNI
jgi:antitoxin component YwqK of YwqJK toxin-antitoxin module